MNTATRLAMLLVLPLLLASCGGDDGGGSDDTMGADEVHMADVVDNYVCTNEATLARDKINLWIEDWPIIRDWDGVPFAVDISDSFDNAHELLDIVADEAARIEAALGYPVFVAGDVAPLPDLTAAQVETGRAQPFEYLPPYGRIHVHCCISRRAGMAWAWKRIVLLNPDPYQARHAIVHELWHLPGFDHPGSGWVEMSNALMDGNGGTTRSTAEDMAKLACIMEGN